MSENPPRSHRTGPVGFQLNADDTPREETLELSEEAVEAPAPKKRAARTRASRAPLSLSAAIEDVPDAVRQAWDQLSPAERRAAEAKGISPQTLAADLESTQRAKSAVRRKSKTPLVFTSSTSPLDALPKGVNPDSLEKARLARERSAERLRTKRNAPHEERAALSREELAQEIVDRTPDSSVAEGWSGPVLPETERPVSAAPAAEDANPEPDAEPEVSVSPEAVPQRTKIGAGMSEAEITEGIASRRAQIEKLNLKERRTKAGSMDHNRHEKEALALEQEVRDLEEAHAAAAADARVAAEAAAAERERQGEIRRIRERLDVINLKERRTKAGSMDHDRHEKEALALEDQIRALEKAGRRADGPPADASPSSPTEGRQAIADAVKALEKTAPSAETTAAPRLSPQEQAELAKRFSPEDAARIFQTGAAPERSPEQTGSAPAEPEQPGTPEAKPAPEPEQSDIVMLNSVLTKQAFGGGKKNKAYDRFVKKYGAFPAAGAGGTDGASIAPPTARAPRPERLTDKLKKRWPWLVGLAGVAALLAPYGLNNAKKEGVKQAPPAATKSAKDAGITAPAAPKNTVAVPKPAPEASPAVTAEAPKKPAPGRKTEMKVSAKVEQSWDPAFNRWEDAKDGVSQQIPNTVKLPTMAKDTGYTISSPINNYPSPTGTIERAPAPAPEAPAPTTEAAPATSEKGFEVDPSNTYLYSIPDANEPGGEALVVYGGGAAATSESFMKKLQAYAAQHPGRTIYFDPGVPTVVDGKEVRWVASGVYRDGTFISAVTPSRPDLVGVQLDPAAFSKKVG